MTGRVLYLHGFASGPQSKKAQYFRSQFAQIGIGLEIPDLVEGDFEGLTITGQLNVIERAAGGERVSLIGSSLGGYLAALFAARYPETRRIALLAPGFGFPRRWPERLGAGAMAKWRRTGVLPVFHYGEKAERCVGYQLIEDGSKYEDYPDVTQPCLIYHGLRDDVVPASLSKNFAASRPNVELHLVDSDHELIDVLESMWPRVRDFLA
jgi:hypothetical protein